MASRWTRACAGIGLALLLTACSAESDAPNTEADGGGVVDSGGALDSTVAEDSSEADVVVPDTGSPDTGSPDTDMPDTDMPDAGSPDTDMPDTAVPDTDMPDTAVPDTDMPDTDMPDTDMPDTDTPDTDTPDTSTPDTSTPDTTTPDTTTPDTTTPDSGTPDTSTPACGDGVLNGAEACDDGNTTSGDGCSVSCTLELSATPVCKQRQDALFKGVSKLDSGGGLPGQLIVHGPKACAHALDVDQKTIVASTVDGSGRVLVFGHASFWGAPVDKATVDNKALFLNAVKWLAKGAASPKVGIVGSATKLKAALEAAGLKVSAVSWQQLSTVDVVVATAGSAWNATTIQAIQSHVKAGRGLMLGGQAWWWGSQNKGVDVTQGFKANLVTGPLGVTWSTQTAKQGVASVGPAPAAWSNAWVGLNLATLHGNGQTKLDLATRVGLTVHASIAIRVLSWADPLLKLAGQFSAAVGPVIPTKAKPVNTKKTPLQVLALRYDERRHLDLGANDLTAHPAAKDFPGQPPADAPVVTEKITVDGTHAGLHKNFAYGGPKAHARRATGLYARAGAKLTVTIDGGLVGKGLQILVGAHSDKLWSKDKIERHPNITRSWPLKKAKTVIGAQYGGPLYVAVPAGSKLGEVSVTVAGAVKAPLFILGETTTAQWNVSRKAPGPWAELVGKNVAFTLPSDEIRQLMDPSALMNYWDEVLDFSAELAAIPKKRPRRERICADRQISLGYMHSGYPIMTHLDAPKKQLDLPKLQQDGSWGLFHEIGHNHQWRPTVLDKTTEVTVNLWSVYSCEKMTNKKTGCHPNTTAAKSKELIDKFVAGGAKYADWTPWNALQMYLQLQAEFGWGLYQKLWKVYYNFSAAAEPKNNQARVDTWCVEASKATGKDLGRFFQVWAVPVSEAGCVKKVAALPPWLKDPMRAYFPYPAAVDVLDPVGVAAGKAKLRWTVTDPGGKGATLTLYWGTKDGGTQPSAWMNKVNKGAPKLGVGVQAVSGLKAGDKVFYRARVSNGLGTYWAPKSGSFTAK